MSNSILEEKVSAQGTAGTVASTGMIFYSLIILVLYIKAMMSFGNHFEQLVISLLGMMYVMKIGNNTIDDMKNHVEGLGTGKSITIMWSLALVQWIMTIGLVYSIFS